MATSQNGWPALAQGSPYLYQWAIPSKDGTTYLTLRNGSAGFLICHFLLWFSEVIQPLFGRVLDDWGWAFREIREGDELSNHASGTAADGNAMQHPLGVRGTYSAEQYARMRRRLRLYRGCLRHGIDYAHRADEMHVEVDKPIRSCERVARLLMLTPRGRRILKANPSQRAVILS